MGEEIQNDGTEQDSIIEELLSGLESELSSILGDGTENDLDEKGGEEEEDE